MHLRNFATLNAGQRAATPAPARGLTTGLVRGISMAEMVLALAISTAVLVGVARIVSQGQKDIRSRSVAEQQAAFTTAAAQYYIANKTAMLAAMADGTGATDYCVIGASPSAGTGGTTANNTTKHTCAFDVDWLKWKKAIPASFKTTNVYNQKWTAIFRRVYNGATATNDAELLIVAAKNGGAERAVTDLKELSSTASLVGGNGGYIPASDQIVCKWVVASSTYEACGTAGGWKINVADFVNTP